MGALVEFVTTRNWGKQPLGRGRRPIVHFFVPAAAREGEPPHNLGGPASKHSFPASSSRPAKHHRRLLAPAVATLVIASVTYQAVAADCSAQVQRRGGYGQRFLDRPGCRGRRQKRAHTSALADAAQILLATDENAREGRRGLRANGPPRDHAARDRARPSPLRREFSTGASGRPGRVGFDRFAGAKRPVLSAKCTRLRGTAQPCARRTGAGAHCVPVCQHTSRANSEAPEGTPKYSSATPSTVGGQRRATGKGGRGRLRRSDLLVLGEAEPGWPSEVLGQGGISSRSAEAVAARRLRLRRRPLQQEAGRKLANDARRKQRSSTASSRVTYRQHDAVRRP